MFDHLIRENDLKEVFQGYGLCDGDITFIKEQIEGPRANENISQGQVWRDNHGNLHYIRHKS